MKTTCPRTFGHLSISPDKEDFADQVISLLSQSLKTLDAGEAPYAEKAGNEWASMSKSTYWRNKDDAFREGYYFAIDKIRKEWGL